MTVDLNLVEKNKEYLKKLLISLKAINDPFIHGGPLSQAENEFIWQYVRLNRNYQKEYDRLSAGDLRSVDHIEADQSVEDFCTKFIISNPVPYSEFVLPKTVKFCPVAARTTSVFRRSYNDSTGNKELVWSRRLMELQTGDNGFVIAIINPMANRDQIQSVIDKSVKTHLKLLKGQSSRQNKNARELAWNSRGHEMSAEKLMTALICYLSFKTDSLWIENSKKMSKERSLNEAIEFVLQKKRSSQNGASIKTRITKFHNLSLQSPHCFFQARKA